MPAASGQRRRVAAIGRQQQVALALQRLQRLVALEQEFGQQLNEAGLRLLRASTFSAYCDCRALGLAERARGILATPGTGGSAAAPAPDELSAIGM